MIGPRTSAAANVLLGWFGWPVPQIPKQRNGTRTSYRKTARKRERVHNCGRVATHEGMRP